LVDRLVEEIAVTETTTVRVTRQTHATLVQLAADAGLSAQRLLDELVERERRRRFFDEADAAFRALREDPAAWAEEQAERALWDQTLGDGLAGDE
jgi:hypothetical protein